MSLPQKHVPSIKTSMLGLFEAIAFFSCNPPDITVGQVLFGLSHSTSELNGGDASSGIRLFLCDSSVQLVWWPVVYGPSPIIWFILLHSTLFTLQNYHVLELQIAFFFPKKAGKYQTHQLLSNATRFTYPTAGNSFPPYSIPPSVSHRPPCTFNYNI